MSHKLWKKLKSGLLVTTASVVTFSAVSIYLQKEEFYNQYLIPVIQKFDPEWSHKMTILWLKTGLVPPSQYKDTPLLAQTIKHLSFRNPLGMAAGFDKNGEVVASLEKIGFGFVEVGTITPKPQYGNPKPRAFRLVEDQAIINRYGFNNDGYDVVHERLQKLKASEPLHCVVGVNIGKNAVSEDTVWDYVEGIKMFSDVADYFVINVSSPNTVGLRDLQKKENLKALLTSVLEARNSLTVTPKPLVFLKLSPDLNGQEKKEIANVITDKKCKIDGLIISNTTVDRNFNLRSSFANETGGLSGLPLKERSTELIADMYKLTKGSVVIIGVGGVFDAKDAYDKIKAGASLIQLYTSFTYRGLPLVSNIKKELQDLVTEDNYGNITEAIGKGRKK